MPGRKYATEGGYRYGFNGKENDKDISIGDLDFGARIYDGRLGRWLSTDPLQGKYPDFSPYNFCINNPIIVVDYDGRDIIIVTSSGSFTLAKETLLKTTSGKALWNKYGKSKTHDVYITMGPMPTGSTANASTFYGGKYEQLSSYIDKGKINIKSPTQSDALNSMQGVDVSKSKGRHISAILLNEENFDETNASFQVENSKLLNDKGLLSPETKYTLAEILFHELKSHINLHGAKNEHTAYGKKYSGVFLSAYPPTKGTPAEKIMNELKTIYDKEKADKKAEEKKKRDADIEESIKEFERQHPPENKP